MADGRFDEAAGALIPPSILGLFDDIVGRAVANAPERCAGVPVQKLRPALACVPDLLDQAREVLLGNPIAARQFRQLIGSFGGARVPTRSALRVLDSKKPAKTPIKATGSQKSAANRSQRLISMRRLEPVLAAAVYASRDAKELAILTGSLELALGGADELNTLFDLALGGADGAVIAGAFDTAVRALGFSEVPGIKGLSPGEDGFGFPGPSRGPMGGVPWFDWPFPTPEAPPSPPEPAPIPEVPELDPSLTDQFEQCMIFEIIPELHRLGIGFLEFVLGSPSRYAIDDVSPDNACPGDIITITGTNFSGVTAVGFVGEGGRTISVPPASATNTRITVRLPDQAVSGPVWLHIPVTAHLCLSEQRMVRPGRAGSIIVGRPYVLAFGVDGSRRCVTVGTPARLTWSVEPSDAQIRIFQTIDGVGPMMLAENVPATGTFDLDTSAAGIREFRIDVTNPSSSCAGTSASWTLEVREATPIIQIVGVETTQAIQLFDLTNPGAETNNSIELIANMDTVLRVFVRTLTPLPAPLAQIGGTVEVNGNTYWPINRTDGRPSPFIDAPRDPLRTRTNHSLNFLIPAADSTGSELTTTVTIFTRNQYCGDVEEVWTQTLSWADRPALPVTVRRIADSDGSVISETDVRQLIRDAFRRMPSPRTAISLRRGVFQIARHTTEDNYCHDDGFYQLALSVAYEHNGVEGTSHVSSWVGIFIRTDCDTNGMMSWPYTSTCISEPDHLTAAHELMHTVGLGHTVTLTGGESCEDVGQPVACHRHPDAPDGRLVEVPFDIDNNAAVANAWCLQSYQDGDQWLHPTLWVEGRRLMNDRY